METWQHPQLVPIGVVAEADLTPVNQSEERHQQRTMTSHRGSDQLLNSLSVSGADVTPEGFGGKPLDFSPTQLVGHDGALTLLELQQRLKDKSAVLFPSGSQNVSGRYLLFMWGRDQ